MQSDIAITNALLGSVIYNESQELLCYVSTADEIDTVGIISDALERGKSVFVPKCTDQKGVMIFYRISSLDDLHVDRYGIREPIDTCAEKAWAQSDKSALCVVPALCCDSNGNRLGYGGGYYDRFLRGFSGKTVCLCYSRFSDIKLPVEEHDVICDAIIKG